MENPNLKPLTPVQVLEYVDIFHLKSDITEEQIIAGEEYTLIATAETEELLFRLNFFTCALHAETLTWRLPLGSMAPLKYASEEFFNAYQGALNAKSKYTGYLTAHWHPEYPFLRIEHVEYYPAEMYWFYKSIPEEILRRVYIEVDGMPLTQYLDLIISYRFGWDKGIWLEYDGTGNVISNADGTESYIAYLSELFWTSPSFQKEKEVMQEYGLSENNPITFDWIISHPRDAYKIITSKWEMYERFPGVRNRNCTDSYFVTYDVPFFPEDSEFTKEFTDH